MLFTSQFKYDDIWEATEWFSQYQLGCSRGIRPKFELREMINDYPYNLVSTPTRS